MECMVLWANIFAWVTFKIRCNHSAFLIRTYKALYVHIYIHTYVHLYSWYDSATKAHNLRNSFRLMIASWLLRIPGIHTYIAFLDIKFCYPLECYCSDVVFGLCLELLALCCDIKHTYMCVHIHTMIDRGESLPQKNYWTYIRRVFPYIFIPDLWCMYLQEN